MTARHGWLVLVMIAVMAAGATAQTLPPQNTWSRGTTIDIGGGVGIASSRSGGLLEAGVGWELTPRFGLEGSLGWLDRPGNAEGFLAHLTAQAALTTPRDVVPFVKAGVGLYRMSFDSPVDDVPEFYRRRLGGNAPGPHISRTFTDPAVVFGGGLRVFATRQWSIEPEVTAALVRRNSRSHVVTALTLHVAYHIEEHPITPSTREGSR